MLRILTLFMVLATITQSATIQGTVYNADTLEPADQAIVSINTTPIQRVIAADGEYSFQVTKGSYIIVARYFTNGKLTSFTEENISIVDDGNYSIDLLLFSYGDIFADELPTFDFTVNELILSEQKPSEDSNLINTAVIAGFAIVLIGLLIFYLKQKSNSPEIKTEKKEIPIPPASGKEMALDPELRKIIQILRDNDGRMTQLELRKHFPLSEAKISLMISELEASGIIKKFKKGRGNILKLI
ncbi:winged helix-turn-helix transcriptional regulator [Candidatus Micrarchaeota archaeon]|nr:winged helix-turn-helix transcriptional regulator [Candidatus Micrarchaeota archaeon]